MSIWPSLISAGSKLVGGLFGMNAADKQASLQKQFAKNAIQWKVADAKAAGVSPLFALGAPTVSYQPNMVGDGPLGNALSDMGQDVSRAVEAVEDGPTRQANRLLQGLQLERAGLENDLLRTQIMRNSVTAPPGGVGDMVNDKVQPPVRTTNLHVGGANIPLDPGTSDAQTWENRWGDSELAQMIAGVAIGFNDAKYNINQKLDQIGIPRDIQAAVIDYIRRWQVPAGTYSRRVGRR